MLLEPIHDLTARTLLSSLQTGGETSDASSYVAGSELFVDGGLAQI